MTVKTEKYDAAPALSEKQEFLDSVCELLRAMEVASRPEGSVEENWKELSYAINRAVPGLILNYQRLEAWAGGANMMLDNFANIVCAAKRRPFVENAQVRRLLKVVPDWLSLPKKD